MGLNNAEVRRINRNNVYRYLLKTDADAVTIKDVANGLGLTSPTVASAINGLIGQGIVCEAGLFDSNGGRKSKGYQAVKSAKYAVGVNIAKQYLDFAVIDLSSKLIHFHHVKKELKGNRESLGLFRKILEDFIAESGIDSQKILGIGYSLPAIIDTTGTKILGLHEEMDLPFSFYDVVSPWFDFPARLHRESLCAGMASARDLNIKGDAVYLNLSPSIGGAFLQGGSVKNIGINCRTGEFGHITLVPNGRQCFCGRKGCVNAYCSTDVLTRYTDGDLSLFFAEMENGNTGYRKIWNEYTDYLALTIHDLMTSFDQKVILGGILAKYLPPYMDDIREKVEKIDHYLKGTPYLICSRNQHEYDMASIGAAEYYVEQFIDTV